MKTVYVNLSEDSIENIIEIERMTKVSNKTTALACALNIARIILEEYNNGKEIYVEKNGMREQLILK